MGGPAVSALSCVQHIGEAASLLRTLKADDSNNLSPESKSAVTVILEQLVEAKLAGVEMREEFSRLEKHLEYKDSEIEFLAQDRARTAQLTAEITQTNADPATDASRAATLVKLASFAAADQGFRNLDTFATWFVGGTAAAVALVIGNFEKITPRLQGLDLQQTLLGVVLAIGLVGVAKFFGSLVSTMAHASQKVQEVVDLWQNRGLPVPPDAALESAQLAALPLLFRLLPTSFRRRSYDPTLQARQAMNFLMFAGLSTLLAVGVVLWVLVNIAMNL